MTAWRGCCLHTFNVKFCGSRDTILPKNYMLISECSPCDCYRHLPSTQVRGSCLGPMKWNGNPHYGTFAISVPQPQRHSVGIANSLLVNVALTVSPQVHSRVSIHQYAFGAFWNGSMANRSFIENDLCGVSREISQLAQQMLCMDQ